MLANALLLGTHCSDVVAPLAYIGPGADLALISSIIGLFLTLGTSTLFMVLWPVRSLMRRFRGQHEPLRDDSPAKS